MSFKSKEDIHSSTASKIFGIDEKNLNSDHRRKAKAINFGIIYGISPYGLAKQLSITNSEGKEYIENYFKRFPKIRDYMDHQINFCRKNSYVETLFGRKCFILGINDKNFSLRGFSERQSINAPIQGTAADIIKLAMIELFYHSNFESEKINLLLQVHDELIFEVEDTRVQDVAKTIKKTMEEIVKLSVPLVVDIGIGKNWNEAH